MKLINSFMESSKNDYNLGSHLKIFRNKSITICIIIYNTE